MNKHKGSTFDDFLDDEKLLNQAEATAVKRVIAYQINRAMKEKKINKNKMAHAMNTSRSSLDRLLDPENTAVTLNSLIKAANVLDKKIEFYIR